MKVRSVEELVDILDKNLNRRRRETSDLHLLLSGGTRKHHAAALRRMAIPLLYSHWEGFVKTASRAYLSLVVNQKVNGRELRDNFIALACGKEFREAMKSNSSAIHVRAVTRVLSLLDEPIRFNIEAPLKFEGNLSPKVLKRVFETLGLEYSVYWQKKENFLDDFLDLRNSIAHGTLVKVDSSTYSEIKKFVIEALNCFKMEVENAACVQRYASRGQGD